MTGIVQSRRSSPAGADAVYIGAGSTGVAVPLGRGVTGAARSAGLRGGVMRCSRGGWVGHHAGIGRSPAAGTGGLSRVAGLGGTGAAEVLGCVWRGNLVRGLKWDC